jgi:hypothetical protein
MITVQKHAKYFKQFRSLTIITYLELWITDGVSVSLVTVRRDNKCQKTGGGHCENTCNFLYCNHQIHRDFLIPLYK